MYGVLIDMKEEALQNSEGEADRLEGAANAKILRDGCTQETARLEWL